MHGQNAPYPAGGGVNKFGDYAVLNGYIGSEGTIYSNSNDRTYIIPIQPSTEYAYKIVRTIATGATVNDDIQIGEFYTDACPIIGDTGVRLVANGYVNNLRTGTFSTSENAKWLAIKIGNVTKTDIEATAGTVQIEVGSAVSETYSPYSNICPISGWTGCEVSRTGVNLFNPNTFVSGRYDNADFSISSAPGTRSAKIYLKTGTYTLSANGTSSINRRILNGSISSATRNLPMSFALSADGWFGFSTTDLTSDFKIELGSAATDYEPYTGQTYPITFPTEAGTVYGGTLDVTNGTLTVDRAMVDLGTLSWKFDSSIFYTTSAPLFGANGSALVNNTIVFAENKCEIYKSNTVALSNPVNGRFFVTNSQASPILRVSDSRFSDAASFKTAMDGVKAVIMLKEAVTYNLNNPTEIKSLLGDNNIWADTGDTTAVYRADTTLYINRKIAEAVSALS